jgi:predicted CopG family antitoxin
MVLPSGRSGGWKPNSFVEFQGLKSSEGDFSDILLKCIEQRAKLLDLYPRESSTSASQIQLSEGQLSVIGSLMNERHAIND